MDILLDLRQDPILQAMFGEQSDKQKQQTQGARANRGPPWGAAEGGALLILIFLIAFLVLLLAIELLFVDLGPGAMRLNSERGADRAT